MAHESTSGTVAGHRRAGVLVLVVALVAIALGLQAAPARAALYGPVPADAFGDLQDSFVQQDPLFAYFRSDIAGGYICVVRPGVEGCDSPAFGRATFRIGIGTMFSLVHAGPMPAGSYQLAVENSAHDPIATSDTFTVEACLDCDRSMAQQVVSEFKTAARDSAANFGGVCVMTDTLEKVAGKAIGMRGIKKSARVPRLQYSANVGVFVASPGSGLSGAFTTITLFDPLSANINKALDILKDLSCGVQTMYQNIADDPPDPTFEQVEPPAYATIDPLGPASLDTLVRSVDRERALGLALLRAYERYQGADAAGDADAAERQLRATGEFATALAAEMGRTADAMDDWSTAAASDPELDQVLMASSDVAAIQALDRRIVSDGFTAEETATAHAAGYSDEDLAAIRTHFDRDLSLIPKDTTYPVALSEAADTLRSEIEAVSAFGDAALVAASNYASANEPPVASFTRTPASGTSGVRVDFDASASSDAEGPLASYQWSFGDGTGSRGQQVSHAYNQAGTFTATLTVVDSVGATDTAGHTVTVTAGAAENQPPVATISAIESSTFVPVDVVLDAGLSTDRDGSIVSYSWDFDDGETALGQHVTHRFVTEGTYAVTLTVTDDDGATAESIHYVYAARRNQSPDVVLDISPTTGTAPLTVMFTDLSTDPDGDALTSRSWYFWDEVVQDNETSKQKTLTEPGTYTMTLYVCDERGGCAWTTRSVVVDAVAPGNTAPQPADDEMAVRQASEQAAMVLLNDTDPDGDGLQVVSFTQPQHGHVECQTTSCTYRADADFTGPDSFRYTVSDGRGGSASASVLVTVLANRQPVAVDDILETALGVPETVSVLDNDSDPDGDQISFVDWTDPEHGSVVCTFAGSCTYTPSEGYVGADSFSYTVIDDLDRADVGQVDVTVLGNRPPRPADDVVAYAGPWTFDVLANDLDPDLQMLEVVDTTDTEHGTISCSPTGACLYTPAPGWTDEDAFTYTVRDEEGATSQAAVRLAFGNPFVKPVTARDDTLSTAAGEAAAVGVLANDSPAGLTVEGWSQPAHGTATCTASGECTYTPDDGFDGFDAFTYTASNGFDTAVATVRIAVVPEGVGFTASVNGVSRSASDPADTVVLGHRAQWSLGVRSVPAGLDDDFAKALPRPRLAATLAGLHDVVPTTTSTAVGWTADVTDGVVGAVASDQALLGEAVRSELPAPLPPVSQGTGGDGHVPILVGDKVYAFFHHSFPTSISCVDRSTGHLCPGYPRALGLGATDAPGAGAVVGSKIYVRLASANFYAQTAPVGLFCWDTATAQPCGWTILERVKTTGNLYTSPPQLVDGRLWIASPTGRLHCFDPVDGAQCPSVPTGLPDTSSDLSFVDAVSHGDRVYVGGGGRVACVDVTAPGPCAGWPVPVTTEGTDRFDVVTRHSAAGVPDGVCLSQSGTLACWSDAGGVAVEYPGWPKTENYYGVNSQAETGTRSYFGTFQSGLICWDWVTTAQCEGGDLHDGALTTDVSGANLPSAYGAAFDGTCVVGLGDPGLVFTVDPRGFSPCSSLSSGSRDAVDLRDQRCDGTVGAASWRQVQVKDANLLLGMEFESLIVTVRDGQTGSVLLRREMLDSDGVMDLTSIDPEDHPSLLVQASSQSVDGAPAWLDGVAPSVVLEWRSDPAQLCFQSSTTVACEQPSIGTISVAGKLEGGQPLTRELILRTPAACAPEAGNRPPTAADDAITFAEGSAGTIQVLGNDSDPDGDPLAVGSTSVPSSGAVECSAAGSCVITPAPDMNGPTSFEYVVLDGRGGTDTAAVIANVTPVNDAPGAVDDQVAVDEDSSILVDVVANDTTGPANEGGQVLTVTAVVGGPAHGSASISDGKVRYTPLADYHGSDELTYRVCDDGTTGSTADPRCATAIVRIAVNPVVDRYSVRVDVDGPGSVTSDPAGVVCPDSCTNAFDEGTIVTLLPQAGPSAAFGSWGGACSGSGTCQLTISEDRVVSARFVAVDSPPLALDDLLTTLEDVASTVDVLANDSDPDGDTLAVVATTQPAHGSVTCSSAGICSYTPTADYSGTDTFGYTASARDATDSATVTVNVTAVDDPPQVVPSVSERTVQYSDPMAPIGLDVSDVDTPPAAIQVTATGLPEGITLSATSGGWSIGGTATAAAGTYPVTVTVDDGSSRRSTDLTLTVTREDMSAQYIGGGTATLPAGDDLMSVRLAGQVTQAPDSSPGDITRATVFFEVVSAEAPAGESPDRVVGPVPVDADGGAAVDVQLAEGVWLVRVLLDDANRYYVGPASDPGVVSVVRQPSVGKVTGGGWLTDGDSRGNFGFAVSHKKGTTAPRGTSVYVWREANKVHVARLISWAGGSLSVNAQARTATFTGRASLSTTEGQGRTRVTTGFTMRVDLVDSGSGRDRDAYAVSLTRGGALVHRSGPVPKPLGGGSIVIHRAVVDVAPIT